MWSPICEIALFKYWLFTPSNIAFYRFPFGVIFLYTVDILVKRTHSSSSERGWGWRGGVREKNKTYTISVQHGGMEFWSKVVNHLFLFGGHIFSP